MGIPGVQAPSRLGRYELLARLATGGMGEIFLARLEGAAGFEKLFVVKRILPHLADDQRFRQMLIAEARLSSRLSHANICQVYELGETDGHLYIVMEYLDGITILPLLRKASKEGGALDFGFVSGIIQQASDALHYAHELKEQRTGENLGIVHRDVTPSNAIITYGGVVKLTDFGIAKAVSMATPDEAEVIMGKLPYMSPEQAKFQGTTRQSDVFSLGLVMYELLTNTVVYNVNDIDDLVDKMDNYSIKPPRRLNPHIPEKLEVILMRALEVNPANRYKSAKEFCQDLEHYMYDGGYGPTNEKLSRYLARLFPEEATVPIAGVHEHSGASPVS
ncbi:MAG: serine/threonine protein kinase [Planctomycetes bacterium]|nr:serine/threonine protein kinase [Planctomycetota bacterium]